SLLQVIGVGQVQEITAKKNAGVDTNELDELAKEIAGINMGPVDMWHPNCFRCAQCDQLLVDMLYFHYQGKLSFPPISHSTRARRGRGNFRLLIFAREYTFAEEKSWHFDHFACLKCDFRLGGHRYMMKNDHPHCINCYMKHFARVRSVFESFKNPFTF
ncbi:hypothetical protein GCK32_019904, partial [Trichostrongylus colubriformis]